MIYPYGLLAAGVALVGATAIPRLWHGSPEQGLSTAVRGVSFATGLACLIVSLRVLV
jgi:hypothetical protein